MSVHVCVWMEVGKNVFQSVCGGREGGPPGVARPWRVVGVSVSKSTLV